ncbi:hypothetical protein EV198_0182 [Roseivirga ehrenbergii]|uniref:Uncharacterized protein n=1 Tax=Roseivirga ehrenbergii (strain DSM 102268 / JCM 13514 / KCTC 12282 / NCIMB 14502 / KMM 6017) TaxID=279360 RepID=A0A150X070_ROSEK|nr:hypothetical protein [Roseivirga ehrenbergii]KYG72129.1 hypothetical protein MB14_08755 [Roseivirga ehrenbergii]TCL13360.1 hypothetical protein EV198_0182 [Roseivirga ehrenbergii]
MIKIFRKTRQKLLSEGKIGRYLKYAVGEIVLVVIGILIALQLNTLNEKRKSADALKSYYNQILQDLAKDYPYINAQISDLESNIALYEAYITALPNQESLEAVVESSTKLNPFYNNLSFNKNTIETLENTGDIRLLPSNIKNSLIDLKNLQDLVIKAKLSNNETFINQFLEATKLGYTPNGFPTLDLSKVTGQLYKGTIADDLPEIALTLKSAFTFKYVTEKDELKSFNSMKNALNNLFTVINYELGSPHKSIDRVFSDLIPLPELLEEGKTVDEIITLIKEQDRNDPEYNISEASINALGYYYLNTTKENRKALKVFELNIELYPEAWNTYDSYGECLLRIGDIENGIKAYQKSIALNPENEGAIKVLSDLKLEN